MNLMLLILRLFKSTSKKVEVVLEVIEANLVNNFEATPTEAGI